MLMQIFLYLMYGIGVLIAYGVLVFILSYLALDKPLLVEGKLNLKPGSWILRSLYKNNFREEYYNLSFPHHSCELMSGIALGNFAFLWWMIWLTIFLLTYGTFGLLCGFIYRPIKSMRESNDLTELVFEPKNYQEYHPYETTPEGNYFVAPWKIIAIFSIAILVMSTILYPSLLITIFIPATYLFNGFLIYLIVKALYEQLLTSESSKEFPKFVSLQYQSFKDNFCIPFNTEFNWLTKLREAYNK